ncbi:hypothetical protein ACFWOL_33875, partial [Streptomyces sp. NPDC058442]
GVATLPTATHGDHEPSPAKEYATLDYARAPVSHPDFGRARRYLLEHDGKFYDSKAIVGVAHGYLDGQEVLEASEFSGGVGHAVSLLRQLGFTVVEEAASDS